MRDRLQRVVAELEDGRVVLTDSVVERELVVTQSEGSAAVAFLAHLLGQLDELGDDLGCVQRAVGVGTHGAFEHLRELALSDQVALRHVLELAGQQPLEHLDLRRSDAGSLQRGERSHRR